MKYKAEFNNQAAGQYDIEQVKGIISSDMFKDFTWIKKGQSMSFVTPSGVWTFTRLSSDREILKEMNELKLTQYSYAPQNKRFNLLSKLI